MVDESIRLHSTRGWKAGMCHQTICWLTAQPLPPHAFAPAAARKAMQIASDACIYTNDNYTALHIDGEGKIAEIDIKAAASSSDGGKE